MKLFKISAVWLLVLAFIAPVRAQDVITTAETRWAGFYMGDNSGGAWNHTCADWGPSAATNGTTYPGLASPFNSKGTVPPLCAKYANSEPENIHNSFTMNMFRVGFHYKC
jgi:hypothetical protein